MNEKCWTLLNGNKVKKTNESPIRNKMFIVNDTKNDGYLWMCTAIYGVVIYKKKKKRSGKGNNINNNKRPYYV